jgi:hypothetical protein
MPEILKNALGQDTKPDEKGIALFGEFWYPEGWVKGGESSARNKGISFPLFLKRVLR